LFFCFCFPTQEDLLIHGDSVYDIIDKQDHAAIQAELNRNVPLQAGQHTGSASTTSSSSSSSAAAAAAAAALNALEGEHRMFLCRMNVSRNARRQMRFGDQKVRSFIRFYSNKLSCHLDILFIWVRDYCLFIC